MLVPSKLLYQNNIFVRKYLQWVVWNGTSLVISFSRIFSKYQEHPRMLVIHFFIIFSLFLFLLLFWLQFVNNVLSLFLQTIRRSLLYFCKLFTFNSNWSINSPRETAVDIVLDVLENSYNNFYCEVLSKIAAYQHGVCEPFQIKIFPRFSKHKRAF